MEENNHFLILKTKIQYHFDFMRHCNKKGHLVTSEDTRLREVIMQNYYKSLVLSNIFAFYCNYMRKSKSYFKTVTSNYNR